MDRFKQKARLIGRPLDRKSRNRADYHLLKNEQIYHLKLLTTAIYDLSSLSFNTRLLPEYIIPF